MSLLDKKKYYTPDEIKKLLQTYKSKFPHLIHLKEIGRSPQKRPLLLVELTDKKTGSASDKPAVWIDANIHASEITGAQACLHFIDDLVHSKEAEIKLLLKHITFLVLPQISVDGAQAYMKNKFEVRSSPRNWPIKKVNKNLIPSDIDSNGDVLLMRKKDPSGAFYSSSLNPDLLTQRGPFDFSEGARPCYRLYREGLIENYDGFTEVFSSPSGFDYNRQFPAQFRPEGQQTGAGPYPGSEPETQAVMKAIVSYPRIFAHMALHTYGGLVLRPPASQPESKYNLTDLTILKTICDEAARVSDYVPLSTGEDFKYYSRESESGTEDEWTFDQRGIYSMTIEIWDVWKEAGVVVKDHVSRYFKPTEEQLNKIYLWAKKNLKLSDFYQKWAPFQHPQLGNVEIGGWKTNFLFRNPPPKFLALETKKVKDMALQVGKVTPVLKILNPTFQRLAENTFHVKLVIENAGFLPTYGSHQALKVGAVGPATGFINLSRKQKLITGSEQFEMKHLTGRSRFIPIHTPVGIYRQENSHQVQLEWTIQGSGVVDFKFDFERGGVIQCSMNLN